MYFSNAAFLSLLPAALAAVHQVAVGPGNTLTFAPTTVQAAVGDSVQFNFLTQNHTVTAGNANAAVGCTPNGAFYSGFVPATGAAGKAAGAAAGAAAKAGKAAGANRQHARDIYLDLEDLQERANTRSFTVQVTSTNPQVVYCSQAQHCQAGMVMVINPSATVRFPPHVNEDLVD